MDDRTDGRTARQENNNNIGRMRKEATFTQVFRGLFVTRDKPKSTYQIEECRVIASTRDSVSDVKGSRQTRSSEAGRTEQEL